VRCVILTAGGDDLRYHELGGAYFDERRKTQVTRRLVGRLEALGYAVKLEPVAA